MISRLFKKYPSRSYLALTYAISWGIWIPIALKRTGVIEDNWVQSPILGYFGPLMAAFIITAACNSRSGVDRLIRGYFEFKHILPWFLACLTIPVLLWLASVVVFQSVPADWLNETGKEFHPSVGIILFSILCWGVGGEAGWRAHLTTHLEPRHGFLLTSIAVFACWALWFTPLFFFEAGFESLGKSETLLWLFQLFCLSIILGWVFKRTQGNLLSVAILFGMLQVKPHSSDYDILFTVVLVATSMFAIVADRLEDSIVPSQYQIPKPE